MSGGAGTVSPLRRVEEAGFNAGPAVQTILLDGWVLRLGDGYTKRANSANPTYPAAETDLGAKVARCEAVYRGHGRPPIFRLTTFGCPPGLDELLAARGYAHADPTLVLTRSLADPAGLPDARVEGALEELAIEPWLACFVAASGATVDRERQAKHAAMLARIGDGACFGALRLPGEAEPAACGLGVVDGDLVGLFDIVTDRERRGRGYGGALVLGLLRRAAERGAGTAYLQVTAANAPAVRLYTALGFAEAYRYWYRVGEA